jgi:hypothetical protein
MTLCYVLGINMGEVIPRCVCQQKRVFNDIRHMQERFCKLNTYKSKYKISL